MYPWMYLIQVYISTSITKEKIVTKDAKMIICLIVTYLFNTKFDANSINRENSFPWQVYPRFAISKARRPNPAPGTKICTSDGLLEIQLSFDISFNHVSVWLTKETFEIFSTVISSKVHPVC